MKRLPPLLLCVALSSACDHRSDAAMSENEEILQNLILAGYTEHDIEIRHVGDTVSEDLIEISEGTVLLLQGDVEVSYDASVSISGQHFEDERFRLWRAPGEVDPDQSICIVRIVQAESPWGWTVLGPNAQQGASYASYNYVLTNPNTSVTFASRTGGVNANGVLYVIGQGCDEYIWIYSSDIDSTGQASWPPGDGGPGTFVKLDPSFENLWGENNREAVVTHEIGHALGLRHSDWKTRSSCNSWPFTDPEAQSGATQIPGTVDQTENSIMATCESALTNGELEDHDHAALEALWPI